MKKDKSYGAIVIKDNCVLLVKHKRGHWGLPKGHKENDETDIETAIREVKEETNVDIEIISDKFFVESYTMDNGVEKDVIYYIAKPVSDNLVNQEEEISIVEYMPYKNVESIIDYDDAKEFWRSVVRELLENGFFE